MRTTCLLNGGGGRWRGGWVIGAVHRGVGSGCCWGRGCCLGRGWVLSRGGWCCPGVGGGCCPGRGTVLGGGGGSLSITGSDIITPPSSMDRQTGVKTLPCPKLRLQTLIMNETEILYYISSWSMTADRNRFIGLLLHWVFIFVSNSREKD